MFLMMNLLFLFWHFEVTPISQKYYVVSPEYFYNKDI